MTLAKSKYPNNLRFVPELASFNEKVTRFVDELIKVSRESSLLNSTNMISRLFNSENVITSFVNITERLVNSVDPKSSRIVRQVILPFLDQVIKVSRESSTLDSTNVMDFIIFTNESFIRTFVNITEKLVSNSDLSNYRFIHEFIMPFMGEIIKVSRESSMLNSTTVLDRALKSENMVMTIVNITENLVKKIGPRNSKFMQELIMPFLDEVIKISRESSMLNSTSVMNQVFTSENVVMAFSNVTERLVNSLYPRDSKFSQEFIMPFLGELFKVFRESAMLNSTSLIDGVFNSENIVKTRVNITARVMRNMDLKSSKFIPTLIMPFFDKLIKVSRELPMLNSSSVIGRVFNSENIIKTVTNVTGRLMGNANWKNPEFIQKIIMAVLDELIQVSRESPWLNSTSIVSRVFNTGNVLATFINVTGRLFNGNHSKDLRIIEEFIKKNFVPFLLQFQRFMSKAIRDISFNVSEIANAFPHHKFVNISRIAEPLPNTTLSKTSNEFIQRYLALVNTPTVANALPPIKPMNVTQIAATLPHLNLSIISSELIQRFIKSYMSEIAKSLPNKKHTNLTRIAATLSNANFSKISSKLVQKFVTSLNVRIIAFLDAEIEQSFTDPHQRDLIKNHFRKVHNILKLATKGMVESDKEWVIQKFNNYTVDGLFNKKNFDKLQNSINATARVLSSGSLMSFINNTVDFIFELVEYYPDIERFATRSLNSFFHNALDGIHKEYGIQIDGEILLADLKRAFSAVYSSVSIQSSATEIKLFFSSFFGYFSVDLSLCDSSAKEEYEICAVDKIVSATEKFINDQIINNLFNIRVYLNLALKWKRAFRKIDDLHLPLELDDTKSLMQSFAKIVVRVQSELKNLFQNATLFEEFARNLKRAMKESNGLPANLAIRRIKEVIIQSFGPPLKSVNGRFIKEIKNSIEDSYLSNRYIIVTKENLKSYDTYLEGLGSFISNITAKLFSSAMDTVDFVLEEGQFERITNETTTQENFKIFINATKRIMSKGFPHGVDTFAEVFNAYLSNSGIKFRPSGFESALNYSIAKLYSSASEIMDFALKEGLFEQLKGNMSAKDNCKAIVTAARRILSNSIPNGLETIAETFNGPLSENQVDFRFPSSFNMSSLGLLNHNLTNSLVEQLKSSPGHIGDLYRSLAGKHVPGDSRSWESSEKADNVWRLFIQTLLG